MGLEKGILGLGDQVRRGDGPGEMGDNLPAVDLGAGTTIVAMDWGDDPGEMGDNLPFVEP